MVKNPNPVHAFPGAKNTEIGLPSQSDETPFVEEFEGLQVANA